MCNKKAFTLVELLVVVMILGALAAIAVPRMISGATNAKMKACDTNVDLLNSQIELYFANTNQWPTQLPDVTSNVDYFPDGAPECPFGAAHPYVYNTTTHRVSGHTH